MDHVDGALTRGFPKTLAADVGAAGRIMPATAFASLGDFALSVDGELLAVPYRIYNVEPDAAAMLELSDDARLVLHAAYTRHHDGFVRQRHVRHLFASHQLWVADYVIRLVGEYVLEIVESIEEGLRAVSVPGSDQSAMYGRFVTENEPFVDLTAARVASYWNVYHRHQYPLIADYPGQVVVDELRRAGRLYGRTAS